MNLRDLSSSGMVERLSSADPDQIKNEIGIAVNDMASAKKMLRIDEWGWAHNAAYNAMLQAGRVLMLAKGYRPKGQAHHLAVVSFMHAAYSARLPQDALRASEKARFRRNESLYDRTGTISESQARNLVGKADVFITTACRILKVPKSGK